MNVNNLRRNKMKKLMIFCLTAMIVTSAQALTVDVYSGHTAIGGGTPYSGLVASFWSPDIMFASNTGYAWHPSGLAHFGAEITGCILVEEDDDYEFCLDSDDGSMLYIDGGLVVNNGGPHVPTEVCNSAYLTAGFHSLKVEFFEDFGGPSGVDLDLPDGVTYVPCSAGAIIDIKPGSCPNPFNAKSQGRVPVAIVGTGYFDPTTVDLDSIRLVTESGNEISPIDADMIDSTQPGDYDPEDCYECFNADDYLNCDLDGDGINDAYCGDGIEDLVLYFDTQELATAIGAADRDDCIMLTLTGETLIGEPIEASDSMVIKTKIKD